MGYKQHRLEWKRLYSQGYSTYDIADEYNCSPETVRQHLQATGVDTSNPCLKRRMEIRIERGEGCWEWQGRLDKDGYGRIDVDGVPKRAHRLVMRLEGHDIKDKVVRHQCHNRSCVNPDHLQLGTQIENIRDRAQQHGHGMLDEKLVEEARRRAAGGENISDLADEMGVSTPTLSKAVAGVTWDHVDAAHMQQ